MFRYIKNAAAYLAGDLLLRAGYVVLMPYYTRHCSIDEYGIVGIGSFVGALGSALSGLSMGAVTLKLSSPSIELSQGSLKGIQRTNLIWMITLGIVVCLVGATVSGTSGSPYALRVWTLYALSGVLNGSITVASTQLQIEGRAFAYRGIALVAFLAGAAISVYLMSHYQMQAMGVAIGQASGALLGLLFALRIVRFRWGLVARANVRRYLGLALPLTAYYVGAIITDQVSRVVIGSSLSLQELGLFTIAAQYATLVSSVLLAFNTAWLPDFFAIGRSDSAAADIRRMRTFVVGCGMALVVGATLVSPLLFKCFFPVAYQGGLRYVPLLSLSAALWACLWSPVLNQLILIGCERLVPVITLATASLSLLSSWLLTPRLGGLGATLGNALGALVAVVCGITITQRCEGNRFLNPSSIGMVVAGTIYVVVVTVWRAQSDVAALFGWKEASVALLALAPLVFGVRSVLRYDQ